MLSLFRALFNVPAILHLRYATNLSRRRARRLRFSRFRAFSFVRFLFAFFVSYRGCAPTNAIMSGNKGSAEN